MISLDELDNRISTTHAENEVVKKNLGEYTNRGSNAPYGLAGNKIADSISKIPIYNETRGSVLDAKISVNPVNFHSTDKKFTVRPPSREHTYAYVPNPLFFNGLKTDRYSIRNQHEPEIDLGFGIPKRKSIVLENPTAQAMNINGQMTESKMSLGIWRDEMVLEDARLQAIINNGSGSATATATTPSPATNSATTPSAEPDDEPLPTPPTPPPVKVAKITPQPIVSHAFDTPTKSYAEATIEGTTPIKGKSSEEEKEETPLKGKTTPKKDFAVIKKIEDNLGTFIMNPKGTDIIEQKEIIKLLIDNNYDTPRSNITKNDTFLASVRKIISQPPSKFTKVKKGLFKGFVQKSKEIKTTQSSTKTTRTPVKPMNEQTEEMTFEKEG